MHINIYQTNNLTEQNVNKSVVDKIYKLVDEDNLTHEVFDSTSNFIGTIQVKASYQPYIDAISGESGKFSNLHISAIQLYVLFADKLIEEILRTNYCPQEDGVLSNIENNKYVGFVVNTQQLFTNNKNITSFDELEQLNKITLIGDYNFSGCTNLRSINLSNITSIGTEAFKDCTSLSININIPNLTGIIPSGTFMNTAVKKIIDIGYVTSIDGFVGCTLLECVENDALQNVSTISGFNGCTSLRTIGRITNCTQISQKCFNGCSSLESVEFPTGLNRIEEFGFCDCTSLVIDNLNLPNLQFLGGYAFQNTKVKRISNLGNITEIGTKCFYGCSLLKTIDSGILQNITSISSYAFSMCTSLLSIDNLENLTAVGNYAFDGCSSLNSLDLGINILTIGDKAFQGCSSLEIQDLYLPRLTYIGSDAFNSVQVYKISSLGPITSISDNAFTNCVRLTTIEENVFKNITEINANAFKGCTELLEVIPSTNTTVIGNNSFENCVKMTNHLDNNLDFGSNVTTLGKDVFWQCNCNVILRNTSIPEGFDPQAFRSFNGYLYVKTDMVDSFKTKYSYIESQIKPLSEIEYHMYDILYSDINGKKKVSTDVLDPSEGYTPIAICVADTNFFGDGERARWLSLKGMSVSSPDTGTLGLPWTIFGSRDFLTNIPALGELYKNSGISSGTCVNDNNKTATLPSVFDNNGNWNTEVLGEKNQYAMTDVNGKEHQKAYLSLAVSQPNWKTDETITAETTTGFYPGPCCAWRYHTLGTYQGDWYIPALGELIPYIENRVAFANKFTLIRATYSNNCMNGGSTGDYLWTSTYCGRETNYRFHQSSAVISTKQRGDDDGIYAMLQY